jgi:hypothetical protein
MWLDSFPGAVRHAWQHVCRSLGVAFSCGAVLAAGATAFAQADPPIPARQPSVPKVDRVVVIKVDGLPERLLEQYTRPNGDGASNSSGPSNPPNPSSLPALPNIAKVFGQDGVWLDHFYVRGTSLSAPSWSLLDTGQHLVIHGNVEYSRANLKPLDYLNFVPFYIAGAKYLDRDMPGVRMLDQHHIPLLLDRFPVDERFQGLQLLQRGVHWRMLQAGLESKFKGRPLQDIFDEWQIGFSMSTGISAAVEKNIVRYLADPKIRYLDYFSGEYDHVAHLTNDRVAQLHVLESLDGVVGRLWAAIQSSPLASNTALILVSDHGMNTSPDIYSQGFNLVDWFNSKAGGGHHVITDRHPLSEFKIRGLDPVVNTVITPSRESAYLAGRHKDYPTVVLDVDGNERANIALRENRLNLIQMLWTELARKDLPGTMRAAIVKTIAKLLNRDDFDPATATLEEEVPQRSLGRLNSIQDLQHYAVGPAAGGLVIAPDGLIDLELSFRHVDYFSALSSLTVKNTVQPGLAKQPVDFIAMRAGASGENAQRIWLWRGPEKQVLLETRRSEGVPATLDIRYRPIAHLRERAAGDLQFDDVELFAGLPLELYEDPALELPAGADRREWLTGWHNEREWFRAVHKTRYSNGIIGLTEQLLGGDEDLRTDLLVFANDHWNFNVRGFNPGGNHGALLRSSTHSVLMFAGGKDTGLPRGIHVATPYDSLSLVPTVLQLMGKPEAELPGPVIEELFPAGR